MRDLLSNTPNSCVRAGEFRGYLLTANSWQKYAKRNEIGAGNPPNWLVNCTRIRQTSFCDFDEAITGAIYFTFHNGKKSSFDRPNYTLIQSFHLKISVKKKRRKAICFDNQNFFQTSVQFVVCVLRENLSNQTAWYLYWFWALFVLYEV